MKAEKNKFNPFKCHPFLAAALIVDNKYLVLRSTSREKFAKEGYYFPGCQMDAKLADRKQLKNQMYTKYRLQVKVGRYLGRETAKLKGHKYCALHLYKCSLTLSNTITAVDIIPHLFSAEELVNIKLIPPDDLMAKRIAVFDKVYRETSRKVALNEHDYALAKMYYKCLLYYRDKIDYQDIIDFAKLFKADASISEIEKAFIYISERSHISLKEYIDMNKALLKKGGSWFMKNNRIVLVLPVLFLLTSCGNQTSIRRDDRGDSSATNSVSIINDDDIFDSIVSGITSDELQEIIDASKKALSGIQSVTTNYASSSYKYEEGFINQSIDESHSLISKTLRYNNSVLYTNNSASYYSDYEEFEFVNDNDEKLLSSFIYLNFNDDSGHFIEKRSVYQKDGETITTVKLDEQIPYSVSSYDKAFLLLSDDKVLDIKGNTDKAEVIGRLNNGSTIARFIIDEETKTDEEGLTTYQIKKVDYIYKNSNLVNINTYILNYIKDDESVLHINKAITISNEYRYIENGTYDKSQMPELTNLENRK